MSREHSTLALALLWLLAAGWSVTPAQMSPGPLSRAHARLDSARDCLQCHARGEDSVDERCLACHTGIAALVEAGSGFHGRDAREDCSSCHPEHAGRDFELILWRQGSPEVFPHARTGWPLKGKHAALECSRCHNAGLRARAGRLPEGAKPGNWIGLGTDCLSCHEDTHRGRLGSDCTACHTENSWREVSDQRMNHDLTRYPLQGAHRSVECAICHDPDKAWGARPAFATCASCHRDPHAGQATLAGQQVDCGACHTVERFKPSTFTVARHAASAYPLGGKHAAVDCVRCHTRGETGVRLRLSHDRCAACHRDPHKGKATVAGKAVDCAACHQVAGFTTPTFGLEQHAASSFPLEGKHRQVACEKCHKKTESGTILRMAHEACRDCHGEAHPGQLTGRADGGACEACHQVDGWLPSTFGGQQHARLDLPLQGGHAEVKCAGCHRPAAGRTPWLPPLEKLGSGRVALSGLDPACGVCHRDPHGGRFQEDATGRLPATCVSCHGGETFRPSLFSVTEHAGLSYPLRGAHQAVPCSLCHAELRREEPKQELLFEVEHARCAACHRTPHGDQFSKLPDDDCATCHGEEAFVPSRGFDHENMTSFSLAGAHRKVPCGSCHKPSGGGEEPTMIIYRQAPSRCQACHAGQSLPGVEGQRGAS